MFIGKIKIGIIGIGNCANALVQGIEYYWNSNKSGLLRPNLAGYYISDIQVVVAVDIDFTPDTIKNLLRALNFKKIKIIHDNFDRDLIAPLNYILREHPNNLIANYTLKITTKKIIRRTFVKIIVNVLSLLGKTSRMTVVAEK